MIELPETAVTDLFTQAQGVITEFWPIIVIVIGIPLAFYILNKLISMITRRVR